MATKTIKLLLILLITGWSAVVHAQYDRNENKIWVFGIRSGIDFNGPVPVAFNSNVGGTASGPNSASQEGCATIADENGRFLFHTNGTVVWDSTAVIMPNGTNILGLTLNPTYSTAQGSVISPVPDSPGQYFIFSLPSWDNAAYFGKLYCSKVRMDLNNGRGDVDTTFPLKHKVLDSMFTERMTIVAGPCYKWLLLYTRDTNSFKAFRITSDGLDPRPVVSYVGNFPRVAGSGFHYRQGSLKGSPDGKMLVNAMFKPNASSGAGLELYDFDYETGIVSNARILDSLVGYFAADFSPDNSKLYATSNVANNTTNQIYQFDLANPHQDSIRNSKFPMGTCSFLGDVRLAPDGKIYFPRKNGGYVAGNLALCSIEDPNQKGALANYKDSALILTSGTGFIIGMPQTVIIKNRDTGSSRTVVLDTVACYGLTELTLSTPEHSSNHLWSTGAADSAIRITQGDIYYVSYLDRGSCARVDTFRIQEYNIPQWKTALDTLVCPGFTHLKLHTPNNSNGHLWNDGNTDSVISASQEGLYYVTYYDHAACERTDTFKIEQQDFPVWSITVDEHILGVSRSFESYQWFKDSVAIPGAEDSIYVVTDNALYSVTVGYGICTGTQYYRVNNVAVPDLPASGLRVYPNPASDVVYIDTDASVDVKLYDMSGRAVLAAEGVRLINIAALPQGTYFLQVYKTVSGRYHRQVLIRTE